MILGVCPFGQAWVDIPKGDLDGSGTYDDMTTLVAVNDFTYPYGTYETFPLMEDSDHNKLSQSAHQYSECANAGICNRITGECECNPGLEGPACERMVCPGEDRPCSGHGICMSIKQLAEYDGNNLYNLWDKASSRGCLCDKGYFGGDCVFRHCKYSIDPMYMDEARTIRFPTYYFAILTTSPQWDFWNGPRGKGPAQFRIKFYDVLGQLWYTMPINVGSDCSTVVAALEGIPNNVIPKGVTDCLKITVVNHNALADDPTWQFKFLSRYRLYLSGYRTYSLDIAPALWAAGYEDNYDGWKHGQFNLTGDVYRISFLGNPGSIPDPEIDQTLGDGLSSASNILSKNGQVFAGTWTNGEHGETIDFFDRACVGVTTRLGKINGYHFLTSMSRLQKSLFENCLGQGINKPHDIETITGPYWDAGSIYNPHIIRLTRTVSDYRDGGMYVVIYLDTETLWVDYACGVFPDSSYECTGTYKLLHPFASYDENDLVDFDVYATGGSLQMVSNSSQALFDFASRNIYVANTTVDMLGVPASGYSYDGDISCERHPNNAPLGQCLQKGDFFVMLDPVNFLVNPPYLNMYQVQRMYVNDKVHEIEVAYGNSSHTKGTQRILPATNRKNVIVVDRATNWATDSLGTAQFRIYRFIPSEAYSYAVVGECANRGLCNYFEGTCECLPTFGGDSCSIQDSLIV